MWRRASTRRGFCRRTRIEIVSQYDIVADGSDNFATRYLVNDACYLAKRPLVFAAVGPFDGHLTTFRAFETDADGKPQPSYRCLFPEAPPAGTVRALLGSRHSRRGRRGDGDACQRSKW